jgi:hypothetical protein
MGGAGIMLNTWEAGLLRINRIGELRGARIYNLLSNLLPHRIFLARRLYSLQYSEPKKYDGARGNPVCWHVHQARGKNQSADNDWEPDRVKSEGHSNSLSSQPRRLSLRQLGLVAGVLRAG